MSNAVVDAFVGRTYQRRRRPQHQAPAPDQFSTVGGLSGEDQH